MESLGTKPSTQTLSLLRQLKYIESVMLQGKNVYGDKKKKEEDKQNSFPGTADVEMILLDLLWNEAPDNKNEGDVDAAVTMHDATL